MLAAGFILSGIGLLCASVRTAPGGVVRTVGVIFFLGWLLIALGLAH